MTMEFDDNHLDYRTCAEFGQDASPELFEADDGHLRVGFVCAEHGVHSVVSPFED